jgi:hypothetical protein
MKILQPRFAIFLSGPLRYTDLVQKRLAHLLKEKKPEFFVHVWKSDRGNKVRDGYESDWYELSKRSDTKISVLHEPYDVPFYASRIGTKVNTHSSVNSIIGMFLGLSQLCQLFRSLPDRDQYSHILRVRTDCAFTGVDFADLLRKNEDSVVISSDAGIPTDGWACDHFLCAPAETFLKIYTFQDIHDIYRAFECGQRNPEKTLWYLLNTRLTPTTRIVPAVQRYHDYQIVYSPPRPTDPEWLQKLVHDGRFEEIFLEPETYRCVDEDKLIAEDQAANWAPKKDPFKSPLINKLRQFRDTIFRR